MLSELYERYKDRIAFYVVYIQEAHPSDIWQMESNVKQNVVFASPKSDQERGEIAGACVRKLNLKIPALLDPVNNNSTERAYTGWPDRLYAIDRNGRVVFKSQPGPFGFHPANMRDVLNRIVQ